jgi:hypothetical protein
MSVGNKSTKEKIIKKNLIIMLIVLFTFSITFIACDNDPDETDPALNGKWVDKDGNSMHFNNGTITVNKGESSETGTFKTDGNKITWIMQLTEFDYFESGYLLSKDDIILHLKISGTDTPEKIAEIEELFQPKTATATYFIDGNKLYLISEDEDGNIEDTVSFTFNK